MTNLTPADSEAAHAGVLEMNFPGSHGDSLNIFPRVRAAARPAARARCAGGGAVTVAPPSPQAAGAAPDSGFEGTWPGPGGHPGPVTVFPGRHSTTGRPQQVKFIMSRSFKCSSDSDSGHALAAGKRPGIVHGIFLLEHTGVYKPPAVPSGAAQGAHYPAGTRGPGDIPRQLELSLPR